MICSRAYWLKGTLIVVLLLAASAFAQEKLPFRERTTPELVEMLGSERFTERDAAQRALMSRDDALPLLRRLVRSGNAEASRRATVILSEAHKRKLPQFLEYGRCGRIDVLLEWMSLSSTDFDDDKYWQGIVDIAMAIRERAKIPARHPATPLLSLPDTFRDWLKTRYKLLGPTDVDYRVRPENVDERKNVPGGNIFASRGTGAVNTTNLLVSESFITITGGVRVSGLRTSIVFANNDVSSLLVAGSLVVCDGIVESARISSSIVIARKGIHAKAGGVPVESSHLYAGKRVRVVRLDDYGKPIELDNNEKMGRTLISQGQRDSLGVRFFETLDLGIEVCSVTSGVTVSKLTAGWPPEKSGLRINDMIVSVNGKKILDIETFRSILRRAYVQEEANFIVRRGNDLVDLTVHFDGFDILKRKLPVR